MRSVLLVVARIVASLAIAGLVLWFGVLLPHQQAVDTINRVKVSVSTLQSDLSTASQSLKQLPAPSSIKLRASINVKRYVVSLYTIETSMSALNVEPPKPQNIYWSDKLIRDYNKVVDDKANIESLTAALIILRNTHDFVSHQRQVMNAVASFLDYDPVAETQGLQPDTIRNFLDAAATGIQSTQQKLASMGDYKGDPLGPTNELVAAVEAARLTYYNSLDSQQAANKYIAAVKAAQESILAGRDSFWQSHSAELIKKMRAAVAAIESLSAGLGNL